MASTSNVPAIEFTPQGLILPSESAILAGVQADTDTAFGGGLNPQLSTPQGQISSSTTAIIGDKNNEIAIVVNQVDPQFATGRFQDAIGRIYFLNRIGATSTAVAVTLTGVPGTIVPVGTFAQDTSGNTYSCVGTVTIGSGGTVAAEFQNVLTGPIPCAANTLTQVYQLITGWDAINNDAQGVLGSVVESQSDFELRRQNSVALNARGTPPSIYANVFDVPDVLDVYVIDNALSPASFVGSITATTLTVTGVAAGLLQVGSMVVGVGVTTDTYITAILTGTGKIGTYTVNHSQSVSSENMQSPGVVVGSTHYPLVANSVYVAVVGGDSLAVATAIWQKKDTGCSYNGNTTVVVTDDSYSFPQPQYNVTFNVPTNTAILFSVDILNNPNLPANITDLITNSIIARFTGADGTTRERIGGTILSGRYYSTVALSAPNVAPVSILIGTSSPTSTTVDMGIDQEPTIDASNIVVNMVTP